MRTRRAATPTVEAIHRSPPVPQVVETHNDEMKELSGMLPKPSHREPVWRDRNQGRPLGARGAALAVLLLLLVLLTPGTAASTQSISFLDRTVNATGVSPRGCTVFMGTGRSPGPWLGRAQSWIEPVVDTAGLGTATLTLGTTVPGKSIWAAIDVTTGSLAVAAPAGFAAPPERVDPLELFGTADVFETERVRIELLIVRPGIGAYFGSFHDGAGRDTVADGAIRVPVAALGRVWPQLGGLPSLSSIEPGDVVVGFDPVSMTHFAFEFPAP